MGISRVVRRSVVVVGILASVLVVGNPSPATAGTGTITSFDMGVLGNPREIVTNVAGSHWVAGERGLGRVDPVTGDVTVLSIPDVTETTDVHYSSVSGRLYVAAPDADGLLSLDPAAVDPAATLVIHSGRPGTTNVAAEDAAGRLWVVNTGCRAPPGDCAQLSRFDPMTGDYTHFLVAAHIGPSSVVESVAVTASGQVFIGWSECCSPWGTVFEPAGFGVLNTTSGAVTNIMVPRGRGYVRGLAVGADGGIWFTTVDTIGRIDPSGPAISHEVDLEPHDAPLQNIVSAGTDGLWVTGFNGFFHVDLATARVQYYDPPVSTYVLWGAAVVTGDQIGSELWMTGVISDRLYRFVPGTCEGRQATVDLTWGHVPTSGADVVVGGPTSEDVNLRGGADLACLGGGDDEVIGGGGADRILLGSGNDTAFGETGNDRVVGGAGRDVITLGPGNDVGSGDDGNDVLSGGPGNDELSGKDGSDRLGGNSGVDDCHGGPGLDLASECEVRTGIP